MSGRRSPASRPPAALAKALRRNAKVREVWDSLPPSHRRRYAEWVDEAKRPETRQRRAAKSIEMLIAWGEGRRR